MADFPSKVYTVTGAPDSRGSPQGATSFRGLVADVTSRVDVSFFQSIVAILMIIEIVRNKTH